MIFSFVYINLYFIDPVDKYIYIYIFARENSTASHLLFIHCMIQKAVADVGQCVPLSTRTLGTYIRTDSWLISVTAIFPIEFIYAGLVVIIIA